MWKTPHKSPATTAAVSSMPATGRTQDLQLSEELFYFPMLITQNPQYSRLYHKIYKSQQKAYVSISQQEQKQHLNSIKETITEKLKQQAKLKSFYKKFGKTISYSARKLVKKDDNSILGLTRQQENNTQLCNFLMDHRNAVQLQEQARLAEYHLRDQQKNKSNIQYLNRVELTDKHRRTAPNVRNREEKLFKINNELNYQVLRKTAYIRNDKLISMSIKNAKNNPTYLRMKNFAQIQYILDEDHQNLMTSREIPKDSQKQRIYNLKSKLFLSLAMASDTLRTYYEYIRENQFNKLVELIIPCSPAELQTYKLTSDYIYNLINKITRYKQNKVIHFEDFNQIIQTLQEQKQYDFMAKVDEAIQNDPTQSNKYWKLIRNGIDEFMDKNHSAIMEVLKVYKIEAIAKKIYELNKNRIIGREYLPLRDILQVMKSLNLVPKVITMSRFMHTCLWYQTRRQGFNLQEFLKIQIAIGLDLSCSLEGLHKYFQSIDVGQLYFF